VFTAAEVTRHAQGLRIGIHDDHGVRAIFVAAPAVVFDRLAGAVLAVRRHRTGSILSAFVRLRSTS
jgi:hypothetical protein